MTSLISLFGYYSLLTLVNKDWVLNRLEKLLLFLAESKFECYVVISGFWVFLLSGLFYPEEDSWAWVRSFGYWLLKSLIWVLMMLAGIELNSESFWEIRDCCLSLWRRVFLIYSIWRIRPSLPIFFFWFNFMKDKSVNLELYELSPRSNYCFLNLL